MNKIQEPHEEYGGLSTQLSSRFISDTFKYSPATLIPAVMALISSIVFTRMFTTIEFGIYSSILAITSPTVTILTEWLGQSTGRFYAEYKQKGQLYLYQSAISKCLQTIFLFSFIISISLLILGTLDVFEFWLFEIPLLIGLISVVLTQIIQTITIRILPVSFKIFAYRNTLVGVSILTFLFSLGLSYFLGPKAQYLLYGSSLSVAIFIPYLLLKSDLWQHTKTISTLEPEAIPLIGRFAKYGIPITMWFFASQLLRVSDRFIILYFLGPSAVGEYSANYSLVTQASELLTGPLLAAAVPILYEQWAHRNIATTRKTLADMTDIHLLVGFALFGGFATVGQQFATLLIGENFHAGAIILMPVLAGSLIWGASMYGHKSMEMTERPSIMIINIFVAAAINFILNILLIPQFGYLAAAYTTFVGYLVYASLTFWQSRHLIPWDIKWIAIAQSALAALIGYFAGRIVIIPISSKVLQILIGGLGFIVVFIFMIFVLRKNNLMTMLNEYFKKPES